MISIQTAARYLIPGGCYSLMHLMHHFDDLHHTVDAGYLFRRFSHFNTSIMVSIS